MKKFFLTCIIVLFTIFINAQAIIETKYYNDFQISYGIFPNIPKGILEAISYTNTRFTHLDSTISVSFEGVLRALTIMGLTKDGKNYFRENLDLARIIQKDLEKRL